MNDLSVFHYEDEEVRTVIKNGEPWFYAIDISRVLGYSETRAMTKKLDIDEVSTCPTNMDGQVRHLLIVNESGLYAAILRSSLPGAKKFKKWVTGEVLPAIRKTGAYSLPDMKQIDIPKTYGEALLAYANTVIELEKKNVVIEEQRPKVEQWDAIVDSGEMYTVNDVAKTLYQTQVARIGSISLFRLLRDKGVLLSSERHHNEPAQRYIDNGCMATKLKPIAVGSEKQKSVLVPLITAKGITMITNTLNSMPACELYKYGKASCYRKEKKRGFPEVTPQCKDKDVQMDLMEVI